MQQKTKTYPHDQLFGDAFLDILAVGGQLDPIPCYGSPDSDRERSVQYSHGHCVDLSRPHYSARHNKVGAAKHALQTEHSDHIIQNAFLKMKFLNEILTLL